VRLLIVSGAFPPLPCGEATNTFFLCQHLARQPGLDVHLLTTRRNGMPCVPGVTIHDQMRRWSWSEVPKFTSLLRELAPDAILLFYIGGIYDHHPMITFAPSIARRVLPSVRFVTRLEYPADAFERRRKRLLPRIGRKLFVKWFGVGYADRNFGTLLSDSDKIIALCDHHRSHVCASPPGTDAKITLIPPPSNVSVIEDIDGRFRKEGRERIGAGAADFVVGYMGYLYFSKGVETLLRAIHLLRQRRPNLRLLIAGGPGGATANQGREYSNKLRHLSVELGIDEQVTWIGDFRCDDVTFPSLVHGVDAWVLPFDDGMHLNNSSFASLASYRVPLIATQGDYQEAAFVNNENMLLCPPKDPVAIAEAIDTLMSDSGLRQRLADSLGSLADRWLSWDSAVARTLATLNPACTAPKSRDCGEMLPMCTGYTGRQ
jgi:glycosyltransferase involved in cell wall biosynthesis